MSNTDKVVGALLIVFLWAAILGLANLIDKHEPKPKTIQQLMN